MTEATPAAPPPPPPPPPVTPPSPAPPSTTTASSSSTKMMSKCLSTIVSYPSLLQHEESLSTQASGSLGAYDVTAWMTYLESLDDALDILKDGARSLGTKKRDAAHTSVVEAGGRTFRISAAMAPGITHTLATFSKEIRNLIKARMLVGERAVSLLPGSYKLWKNHLLFLTGMLSQGDASFTAIIKNSENDDVEVEGGHFKTKCNSHKITPYLLTSTSRYAHFAMVQNAYERSLVRLQKCPAIWLHYASFLALHSPERDPTSIRRIYDRALVALPASQHDRIWEDYICWITGILPGKNLEGGNSGGGGSNNGGDSWKNVSRKGMHKVKYGFESPLVAEWRKRGWGYHQIRSSQSQQKGGNNNNKDKLAQYESLPVESALRILRRHAACYDTTFREDLATLCITRYSRFGEAASLLLQLLNNAENGGGEFLSVNGTTRHELWLRFADVCTAHPKEAQVAGVDFDGIVRAVLKGQDIVGDGGAAASKGGGGGLGFEVFDNTSAAFGSNDDEGNSNPKAQKEKSSTMNHRLGEMEGTLWTRLAEYHVRYGNFELARSVYEEALESITRVRDFSLLFDAYVKFEEGVIEALMELMEEEDEEEDENNMEEEKKGDGAADDEEDLDILLGNNNAQNPLSDDTDENAGASADVELAISRAEHLTSRRPLLLNRVLLRQNPHNVGEWIKRSKLYLDLGEGDMAAKALEEGLKSVNAHKAVNGSPCMLVLTLIDVLENDQKNVDGARKVLERICSYGEYNFGESDDLAQCHSSWVELELRQENWDEALQLARRAVSGRVGKSKVARGLSKSLRLWNLLFDLEESLGTVQTTKDAYDRALELKVATPSHALNYATFLKDQKYFEESFAAYERGVGLFPFPHPGATLLWKNYLTSFLERYGGSKTPRTRELFDRCLDECPSEESPEFYLLYGDYEETHGLAKRALGVYERMCANVPPSEKYTAYRLYIAKAIQYLGVTSARPIYESAISAMEDGPASRICLEYAKMETGLRETDRARAVLAYGAQLADPRRDPDYWKAWHEFEVSHGNEETFREMLRVKRAVQAAFSTVNYNAAEMGGGVPKVDTLTDEAALEMIAEREGLDGVEGMKKPLIGGFVQGKKRSADAADLGEVERRAARLRQATGAADDGDQAAGAAGGGDDEIDIDDIDDAEEEQAPPQPSMKNVKGVSEKAIPAAVFGGLAAASGDDNN